MRYPFTLVKIKSKLGTIWHARFWDEETQKYSYSRSTGIPVEGKKERRREAEEVAKKIFHELTKTLSQPKTTNSAARANLPAPDKSQTHTAIPVANMPLIQYLGNFWSPTGQYANFMRYVEKHPLTYDYIHSNHEDVRRHVKPFPAFAGVTVGSLTKATLRAWLIWLASRKTQRRKKDGTLIEGDLLSSRRANNVLQSVRVAVRWAFDNDQIPVDPFHNLGDVTESMREKGVLSLEERNRLIELPLSDPRTRLVMLLGSLCGLRRGEMRGLQWGDIEGGLITVQHNYQDNEGMKLPKYNSVRKVPITEAVQKVLDIVFKNAFETSPESFVFASPRKPGKPVSNNFFRDGVAKEFSSLGITEAQQEERFLSCHSLRHSFVTLSQLMGIPDIIISALAGHKNVETTGKYSHVPQIIDFGDARKKLEASYQKVKCSVEKKAVNH